MDFDESIRHLLDAVLFVGLGARTGGSRTCSCPTCASWLATRVDTSDLPFITDATEQACGPGDVKKM